MTLNLIFVRSIALRFAWLQFVAAACEMHGTTCCLTTFCGGTCSRTFFPGSIPRCCLLSTDMKLYHSCRTLGTSTLCRCTAQNIVGPFVSAAHSLRAHLYPCTQSPQPLLGTSTLMAPGPAATLRSRLLLLHVCCPPRRRRLPPRRAETLQGVVCARVCVCVCVCV